MTPGPTLFVGIELSSGRKPITFAGLGADLTIEILETWGPSDVLACLQNYENTAIAINLPASKTGQQVYTALKDKLAQREFKSSGVHPGAWLETRAQDCFQALGGGNLFLKRSLEGRLQRCAILYEQGLQITDPIDMLEEMTRYRLIRGILPLENLPSSKELDALMTAYLVWLSVNRPQQVTARGALALPAREESSLSDESPVWAQDE